MFLFGLEETHHRNFGLSADFPFLAIKSIFLLWGQIDFQLCQIFRNSQRSRSNFTQNILQMRRLRASMVEGIKVSLSRHFLAQR